MLFALFDRAKVGMRTKVITSKTVYKCCSALCVCFIRTRTSSVRCRQSTHGKFMAMKISSNHSWANSHSLLLSCRWIVFCCRAGHSVPQHIMASVECQTRHYHLIWLILLIINNQSIYSILWSSGKGKGKGWTQEGHSKVIYGWWMVDGGYPFPDALH